MSSLNQALRAALDARQQLISELHAQGTDCYRLFHGSQEGAGGLTLDRYGPQLLVQSFHQTLERDTLLALHATVEQTLGLPLLLVYNDRSQGNSRIDRRDPVYQASEAALADLVAHEWGLNYRVRGRHAGQDPLLFLDLRAARGWVKQHSAGKRVLNLFAYTCGFSVAALAGGARQVVNLDMARAALSRGRDNHRLNQHDLSQVVFLGHDLFKSWGKVGKYGPYDLIIVDPPSFQRGSFVLSKDYPKVLRRLPELLSADGVVLACSNEPEIGPDYLIQAMAHEAPGLRFSERLDNPPEFPDSQPDSALKALVFRRN